jgi:hypothetical protein
VPVSWADVRAELAQRGTDLDRSRDRVLLLGTRYLAIDRSNETIPTLVCPAIRSSVAGAILMGWSRLRGVAPATTREWRSVALVLHEPLTMQILVAAAAILASVALIVSAAGAARDRISGEDRRAKVEPELGFEG